MKVNNHQQPLILYINTNTTAIALQASHVPQQAIIRKETSQKK